MESTLTAVTFHAPRSAPEDAYRLSEVLQALDSSAVYYVETEASAPRYLSAYVARVRADGTVEEVG